MSLIQSNLDKSKFEPLSDKDLLAKIRQKDIKAFDVIYLKYHYRLYVYALKMIKNDEDAADIVQDIFIRFWEQADRIPEELNIRNYLYAMVRNRVLNYIRDNRTRLINNYRIVCLRGGYEEPEAEKEDRAALYGELEDAIESLPPQQRKVAASRKEGLSNAEIAEKLDLSLNTVNVHYRLGLKALRNKLKHLIVLVIILCLC